MIRTKTVIDIAKVALRSVLGTTLRCSSPAACAAAGSRSTGTRSMMLNSRIQQKMVSARGAISLLVPWKVSDTCLSMKLTSTSTNSWTRPGTPAVARRAMNQNPPANSTASNTEKNTVSRLRVEKSTRRCGALLDRNVSWCTMYSVAPEPLCSAAMPVTSPPFLLHAAARAARPGQHAHERDPVHQVRRGKAGQQRQRHDPHRLQHRHEQYDHHGELDGLAQVERTERPLRGSAAAAEDQCRHREAPRGRDDSAQQSRHRRLRARDPQRTGGHYHAHDRLTQHDAEGQPPRPGQIDRQHLIYVSCPKGAQVTSGAP